MGGARYTAEFKVEALKQITEREHGVVEVVKRLGVSDKILYKWLREADLQKQPQFSKDVTALKQEVNRLNAVLECATEERDILKKAAVYFANHQE